MRKGINIFALVILTVLAMVGSVYAYPINVEDVKVQEVRGDMIVLVSLRNSDASTGTHTELSFTIEELGTTVTEDVIVDSNNTEVLSFNLRDVVSNFNLLKKGESYILNVSSSQGDSELEPFLFGSEQENTDGLGLILEEIEVDGVDITDLDTLQVLNGQTLDVVLQFSALENFDDSRIRVSIDGYEHGIIEDTTEIFKAVAGKTYVKRLSLNLPADMDNEEDYKLRIFGANDLSGITYKDITLYVDTQRHRVDVIDLVMTPSSGVEPGQNIIANVRMKNRGQMEQDSIKVTVAIPELGVTESSYVSNLGTDEVVTSDDMLLFVPENAEAGAYEARVSLTYNDGYTQTAQAFSLNVLSPRVAAEKNLLVSFRDNVDLVAGEATSFEVVIANPNMDSKPISLSALDNSWADVEVTPTLKMVQGGSSEAFTVTVTPKDAISGQQTLTLLVKEGSKTVSEVEVQTYVAPSQAINWVNVVLAVLLVIAIIVLLALIVTIARRRGENEDEVSSSEEYY